VWTSPLIWGALAALLSGCHPDGSDQPTAAGVPALENLQTGEFIQGDLPNTAFILDFFPGAPARVVPARTPPSTYPWSERKTIGESELVDDNNRGASPKPAIETHVALRLPGPMIAEHVIDLLVMLNNWNVPRSVHVWLACVGPGDHKCWLRWRSATTSDPATLRWHVDGSAEFPITIALERTSTGGIEAKAAGGNPMNLAATLASLTKASSAGSRRTFSVVLPRDLSLADWLPVVVRLERAANGVAILKYSRN